MFGAVNLFIQVCFPMFGFFNRKKTKYTLFLIELVVSFGLTILSPIITFIASSHFTFSRTPHIPLHSGKFFIAIFLLLCLIDAVGITLIILSVFKLQIHKLAVTTERRHIKLKSFELRFIILSFLLWISVCIVLYNASLQGYNLAIVQYFEQEYWSCLTLKLNPFLSLSNATAHPLTCSTRYREYLYPIFGYIADIALGMWVILLFVILTTKKSRDAWKKILRRIYSVMMKIKNPVTGISSN